MEQSTTSKDAELAFEDRRLDGTLHDAWEEALAAAGFSRKREEHTGRTLLRMGPVQRSGFAHPGVVRRERPRREDGEEHQEDY